MGDLKFLKVEMKRHSPKEGGGGGGGGGGWVSKSECPEKKPRKPAPKSYYLLQK